MPKIYLDNAATTKVDEEVIKTITNVLVANYGNPSSVHQFGRSAKSLIESSRKNIATYFNVSSSEIIFTSGGSEADNLILINAVVNLGVKQIISSKIEHHAVLHTLEYLKHTYNTDIVHVKIDNKGNVDYDHLAELLVSGDKTLVSLMYVNNEIGNLLDINLVCKLCEENNALFHSDTVQAIGHYNIDLQKTPIDFITASAHKFHGAKGVGFAIIKKGFGIKPILFGGAQEKGARAGTENVPNIVGMDKALFLAMTNIKKDKKYILSLKSYFITALKRYFKNVKFNGNSGNIEQSSYLILNVQFNKELPMLLFNLDLKGIAVSGGSACQSGSHSGSHVLSTILSDKDALNASVRFSFSKYNTIEELDFVIDTLKEFVL